MASDEIGIRMDEAVFAKAKSLSLACSTLDKGGSDYVSFNGNDKMKINCFFFPKYSTTEEEIKKTATRLVYRKDIIRLVIEDDISNFGYSGYMDVVDNNNSLLYIFSQHYNQFLSINISSFIGDGELKYEPYLCVVKRIIPLDTSQSKEKTYRIEFRDIVSGLGDELSISSIYAFHSELKDSKNYEEVFLCILRHLLECIYVSFEGNLAYKKNIAFENNSDDGAQTKTLFESLASTFQPDDSYLNILQRILNVASVGVPELEKNLLTVEKLGLREENEKDPTKSANNTIPLFPLFCREEYDDIGKIYRTYFKATGTNEESANVDKEIVSRYISFRNFAMPFVMAAGLSGHSNERYVYEVINPNGGIQSVKQLKESTGFMTLMGQVNTPIKNVVHFPIDTELTKKTWKNVHFFSQGENGVSSKILTLDWMYTYFTEALLRLDAFDPMAAVVPNYLPAFLRTYRTKYAKDKNIQIFSTKGKEWNTQEEKVKQNMKEAVEQNKLEASKVEHCLYNSTAYVCKSKDDVAERCFVVGQMIASFVLLNEAYSIDINGSITRRPNELIYFGRGKEKDVKNGTDEEALTNDAGMNVPTSFLNADHAIFYLKSVTHIFEGENFTDRLFVNKIVESVV